MNSHSHSGPISTTEAVASERLRSFIQRVERLAEEKDQLSADISEVYAEAKSEGFDAKIMRKLIARRRKDPHVQREEDELMELYEGAIEGTPRRPRRDVRQLDLEESIRKLDDLPPSELQDSDGNTIARFGRKQEAASA